MALRAGKIQDPKQAHYFLQCYISIEIEGYRNPAPFLMLILIRLMSSSEFGEKNCGKIILGLLEFGPLFGREFLGSRRVVCW